MLYIVGLWTRIENSTWDAGTFQTILHMSTPYLCHTTLKVKMLVNPFKQASTYNFHCLPLVSPHASPIQNKGPSPMHSADWLGTHNNFLNVLLVFWIAGGMPHKKGTSKAIRYLIIWFKYATLPQLQRHHLHQLPNIRSCQTFPEELRVPYIYSCLYQESFCHTGCSIDGLPSLNTGECSGIRKTTCLQNSKTHRALACMESLSP